MSRDIAERLRHLGILPSPQRVAVAQYVLSTCTHPCAEDVYKAIQGVMPMISLATVYNTLHLFNEKGLLRELTLAEGRVVYDCRVEPHHHLVDVETGAIHDLPWSALSVKNAGSAAAGLGFEVDEYQVVLRGKRRPDSGPATRAQG